MSEETDKKEKLLNAFEEKLDRILVKIEEKKTTQVVDILTALLLSVATIGSAWCAYQSALWGGVQTFELAAAGKAGRLSSENFIHANQKRIFDGVVLMKYIDAAESGNNKLKDFYFGRFDSVLKNATIEWLEEDPINNPNAPNSPMKMQSYKLNEETEAVKQLNLSSEKFASANEAKRNSEQYVLLTVFFAGGLFFGGIAGTLNSKLVRNTCLVISTLIFLVTVIVLINMPVTTI